MNFTSINPSNGQMIWQGKETCENEIKAICSLAKTALPTWSFLKLSERYHYLEQFEKNLKKHSDELTHTISLETGKPLWEAKTEVTAMISKVSITLDAYNQRCLALNLGSNLTRYKPHGVVAVLGPYNFPGHLPNGHIIPALLAGNTVIFKPSELTPLTGEKIASIWQETNLPYGVFNLVQGGKNAGQTLLKQKEINGIFFTGSWNTGKKLLSQFALEPHKILALEMGGNNPLILEDVHDFASVAYTIILSAYITTGQRCSCARRLIIIDNPKNREFVSYLMEKISNLKIGPFEETPEPFIGPLIREEKAQEIFAIQQQWIDKGATSLIPLKPFQKDTGFVTCGLIDTTSIVVPDEEVFGPLLQLIWAKDLQEAVTVANNTQYGLTAGLIGTKQENYQYFFQNIQAGIINWNAPLTGASSKAPFGGIGKSGNFRPSGFYAIDYCLYPVASTENSSLSLPSNLYPGITL